ncbi:phosphoribosylamine--glycine ligase [Roseococcus sp. SDR]|uniref:phosphoribosylamine--glycine ligase n=1 Tax=Roseococcus sp. SDR TaxID=2835532 RepID=UPI001BCAB20B|nr:phosphoribosylamine--glycine ligase [Roseococcus sp. SDR]MBS7792249.1 phosphoribosylamine--glycine ligase [Roseococcus sp. SDR]MBV1847563.1 phosphoribosylamine--glycine ligase [Roseococcus sp. SDR]
MMNALRILPLAALPLLVACTSLEPVAAPPIMTDPVCRDEARRTAERDVARQSNMTNQTQVRFLQNQENQEERRLYNDCLRRRGLPTPGGVEAVQRS